MGAPSRKELGTFEELKMDGVMKVEVDKGQGWDLGLDLQVAGSATRAGFGLGGCRSCLCF